MSQIETTTTRAVIGCCHAIVNELINCDVLEVSELLVFRHVLLKVGMEARIRSEDFGDKVCKLIGELFPTLARELDDVHYSKLAKG